MFIIHMRDEASVPIDDLQIRHDFIDGHFKKCEMREDDILPEIKIFKESVN